MYTTYHNPGGLLQKYSNLNHVWYTYLTNQSELIKS